MAYDLTCESCTVSFTHIYPHTLTCSDKCRKDRYLKVTGRASWQKTLTSPTVGAISEMAVAVDLLQKGYAVFRALSASCFCDLIAIKDKRTIRIEARTGYTSAKGHISYPRYTHGEIDLYGVHVPALSKTCYFDATHQPVEL